MTAFSRVKIRTAAVILCEERVALIHRTKNGVDQYTLPGGNVEVGEPLFTSLRRELSEELGLDLDPNFEPELLAVQDQMVSRPGATPPPRKLHLVFYFSISPAQKSRTATIEHDDLGTGAIVWLPLDDIGTLHLFPAIGDTLYKYHRTERRGAVLLPPLTDQNFQWI